MLPFLKRKQEASYSESVDDEVTRKPDNEPEYDMLDAIAEDMLAAVSKKDVNLLKDALRSLLDHARAEDYEQDAKEMQ